MAISRVPRVARIHFDSNRVLWRVVATWLDEFSPGASAGEAIEKVLTLAQIFAFLVDIWGSSPTSDPQMDAESVGDMGQLAQKLIQDFGITGQPPSTGTNPKMAPRIDVPGQGYWEWTSA